MRMRAIMFSICTLGLLLAGQARAGTTGKVTGTVRDAQGQPLPGANVVVQNMKLGATTDADGQYFIINIPPGMYTLAASLVGFETVAVEQVGVKVDQTTTVDFSLKESTLELGEMVVTAKAPLVEMDKTTSKYTVSLEDTENLLSSVRNTSEILALQPGVSVDGSNRIRGAWVDANDGRGNDVAYVVDGIRMNYNDGRGNGGNWREVNRGAVQQLSVLTGVTPAEYGNAQGGVVQIVTKDGGTKLNGWFETRYEPPSKKHWGTNVYDAPQLQDKARWDDQNWRNERWPDLSGKVSDPVLLDQAGELIHVRTDYTGQAGTSFEGNVSGPIGQNASFVVTARHAQLANPFPGPQQTGFYDDRNRFHATGPDNLTLSGSLTFHPSQALRVKVGGLYQGYEEWSDGDPDAFGKSRATSSLPGIVRGIGNGGRDLFLPADWSAAGKQKYREELEYIVLTHTLSSKTFYEVRLSHSRSRQDTIGAFSDVTTVNNQDDAGWFNVGRQAARYGLADRNRLGLKADLTSQVNRGHLIKIGGELLYENLTMEQRWDSSPSSRGLLIVADKGQIGDAVHPIHFNAYAQDKMEFEGMIVNLGLRMDTFSPNALRLTHGAFRGSPMFRTYTRARDYAYNDGSIWVTKAPWQMYFSPRIGISHPITEHAQFRFSSGVFLQWSDLFYYYGEDYYTDGVSEDIDINGNGIIDETERYNTMETTYSGRNGTPLLRPAKTTNFEVGADWNFVSDYTAGLTAYYKSEVEQFTWYPNETWQGARDKGIRYSRTLDNGSYGDTRGVELSVRKAFSNHFSFQVSYNYQFTEFTTGKLGNVIRNIYTDSSTVARLASEVAYTDPTTGAQVPDLWVDWTADPSGREVPVIMNAEDIAKYGHDAQTRVNSAPVKGQVLGTGVYDGLRPAEGKTGEYGVQLLTGGYSQLFLQPKGGDHKHFGSASINFALPNDVHAGPFGGILRNIRINLITRLETGGLFLYSPPEGGQRTYRDLSMDSRTDLAVEKTFNVNGRVRPTLFLDVRNLFNQRDRTSPTNDTDYTYYGITGPRPNDDIYLQYGDVRDRTYANNPRLINLGARLAW